MIKCKNYKIFKNIQYHKLVLPVCGIRLLSGWHKQPASATLTQAP